MLLNESRRTGNGRMEEWKEGRKEGRKEDGRKGCMTKERQAGRNDSKEEIKGGGSMGGREVRKEG